MTEQALVTVLRLSQDLHRFFAVTLNGGNSQAGRIPSHKNFYDVPPQPKGSNP